MNIYWKVHIDNYDYFIEYILKKFNNFFTTDFMCFKEYYYKATYLHLCIDVSDTGQYILTYMDCNIPDKNWLIRNNWKYMGEFYGRREKLVMLDSISKL